MIIVQKADPTALHPDVVHLAFLLGRWAGEGEGEYPTIEPFRYGEELTFSHVGKPFLAYAQRSWSLEDGRPLHAEMGYWKCSTPDLVEVVIAHPTGHSETSQGSIASRTVSLESVSITRTSSAKQVDKLVRHLEVEGDHLNYELKMAAVSQPLSVHLRGAVRRMTGPYQPSTP